MSNLEATGAWLFRLLHEPDLRNRFLGGEFEFLPEELREEFASIDRRDFQRSAEGANALLAAALRRNLTNLFSSWRELAPEDPEGRALVREFQRSDRFRNAANFAWDISHESVFTAFVAWCQEAR